MPGPAAAVPIVLAAGIIRAVAPSVARTLIQSGVAKKATKKMVDSMKGYIPKATKKEAENLAKKPAGRTSPTSARPPKNTGVGQQKPTGNRGAGRKPPKEKTPNTSTSPTSAPKPKNTGVGQQKPRPTGNRGKGRKPPKQPVTAKTPKQPTSSSKPTPPSKPRISDVGKTAIGIATTAAGLGGLSSLKNNEQNKKLEPVPEVNVRTLPEPKTVPEPKPKTAPKPKPKPKEKFDTEGGLYKQYEFAKKRDLPISGATQKYYDQMENVALNKKGGMIKKSAVKKRKGFSGRGVGAARRGF